VIARRPLSGAAALFVLAALTLSRCAAVGARTVEDPGRLVVQPVDPLEKVFRETAFFPRAEATTDVARGETASFQFVVRAAGVLRGLKAEAGELRSDAGRIGPARVGYIGYIRMGRTTAESARDRLSSPSGFYPDPILAAPPDPIPPLTTQPVWVSVPVRKDAPPGLYKGKVVLNGELDGRPFRVERPCEVRVHSPVVDKTRLWVTNWFAADPDRLKLMNGGRPVEPFSERHWELVRALARAMAAYRQNVALISPLHLAQYTFADGRYGFDFSRFDRMVGVFIEEGVIGRIEGGHIGGRESTWLSPFVVMVPEVGSNGAVEFRNYPMSDGRAVRFYGQFLPALTSHLAAKGWSGIYLQHLADEPAEDNFASYVEIARFVKKHAPGLKTIEACHSRNLAEMLAVWVPQLNYFDSDGAFYAERAAKGDEVWFYTCVFPQGEYANRFIEQPLIKTRLLHWINFRYGSPGYLHWGLNWWSEDPFYEATRIQTESGLVLPAGDSWIVYPAEGGVLPSIRLEAMRDGIVDHELLCRLAEKRPAEAKELARQLVYGFTQYDIDIPSFREKRRTLLKMLAE
jgi:hypothetical protein